MTDALDDSAWFAAKSHGYGAGLPLCWQGWALLIGHVLVILAGTPLAARSPAAFTAYAVVMAMIPMPLYATKTRGGWKWRWGGKD